MKQVLSAANETGLIGAISWVADFSEGVSLDCSATLWEGPSIDWPDNRPLDRATKLYAGILTGTGLERFATCAYSEDEVYEDAAGFRPLAGLADTSRYGYMQAEIFVRSIFVPVVSTTKEPVIAVPMGSLIAYRRGANTVGHYGYWNISWEPSHLRSGGPRCGTFLILTERDVRKRAFYTWHCRRFTGKQGYGEVDHEDMYGILALED